MAGFRENFRHNLTRLMEGRGNNSLISRKTGISRQQLITWRNGDALPNAANLAKLCRYFGVREEELFGAPSTYVPFEHHPDRGTLMAMAKRLEEIGPAALPAGIYLTDFEVPRRQDRLVRSVTIIRHDETATTFRRLTGFEFENQRWAAFQGDHRGIVMERAGTIHLVAIDMLGLEAPSLIVARRMPTREVVLAGVSIVNTPDGVSSVNTVLSHTNVSLRNALKQSGIYPVSDARWSRAALDHLLPERPGRPVPHRPRP